MIVNYKGRLWEGPRRGMWVRTSCVMDILLYLWECSGVYACEYLPGELNGRLLRLANFGYSGPGYTAARDMMLYPQSACRFSRAR